MIYQVSNLKAELQQEMDANELTRVIVNDKVAHLQVVEELHRAQVAKLENSNKTLQSEVRDRDLEVTKLSSQLLLQMADNQTLQSELKACNQTLSELKEKVRCSFREL